MCMFLLPVSQNRTNLEPVFCCPPAPCVMHSETRHPFCAISRFLYAGFVILTCIAGELLI